jgi:hypothetical protein
VEVLGFTGIAFLSSKLIPLRIKYIASSSSFPVEIVVDLVEEMNPASLSS